MVLRDTGARGGSRGVALPVVAPVARAPAFPEGPSCPARCGPADVVREFDLHPATARRIRAVLDGAGRTLGNGYLPAPALHRSGRIVAARSASGCLEGMAAVGLDRVSRTTPKSKRRWVAFGHGRDEGSGDAVTL